LALERWVEQRFFIGIYTSPSKDPASDQRPPPTLWEQIDRIIDRKLNNENNRVISSEGSSSQQQDKKGTEQDISDTTDFEDFDFEDFEYLEDFEDFEDFEYFDEEESDCWFNMI
jgi:hypothetical protein